jgi:hypothetical protein
MFEYQILYERIKFLINESRGNAKFAKVFADRSGRKVPLNQIPWNEFLQFFIEMQ